MTRKLLMGNQALAFGALAAGVNVVCGYPGTPSSEVLETVAANNPGNVHVEWSTNEKAALEVAAGASYCGARALVTMKQVGLNVASDPLMSLNYIGVKGGVVVLVADDPGPISSQTEQDTRRFASFAKIPVLDPSSPEEGYAMMQEAFELSERFATPVIIRPTTRVCHGSAVVDVDDAPYVAHEISGFERDSKWIIFPRRAYLGHLEVNERLRKIADLFSNNPLNSIEYIDGHDDARHRVGIAAGGVSYAYAQEALLRLHETGAPLPDIRLFKVSTPYPFPSEQASEFLRGLYDVIVFEELDHVIEDELLRLVGMQHLPVTISGKLTGEARAAGENTVESVMEELRTFLRLPVPDDGAGAGEDAASIILPPAPELPARPPVLCAGCPHRASFSAVKRAVKGRKAFFAGDIGCYTLGNAKPLEMVDTCLCMGADITIAQGMHIAEPDALHFAFIGDSTFFASGMTGVANAVYNGNDITIIVLDNSTTAMTGQQPHPGTGIRMTNPSPDDAKRALSIPTVLTALGVAHVSVVDPFDMQAAENAVRDAVDCEGIGAVVFKSPCIALCKPSPIPHVDQTLCKRCRKCIDTIGCPAICIHEGEVTVDKKQCHGCGLCVSICPFDAIVYDSTSAGTADAESERSDAAAMKAAGGADTTGGTKSAGTNPTSDAAAVDTVTQTDVMTVTNTTGKREAPREGGAR